MTTPDYNPAETEARWQRKWRDEPVPAPPQAGSSPTGDSPVEASSEASPPTQVSEEVKSDDQNRPDGSEDEGSQDGSTSGEAQRAKGEGKRSRGKRRGRTRFYAFPAPVSASVFGAAWPELRRYVAADLQARVQRHSGMEVSLPVGFSSWGADALESPSLAEDSPEIRDERQSALHTLFARAGIQIQPGEWIDDGDPAYYRWTQWIFLQMVRGNLVTLADPHAVRTLDQIDPDTVEGIEDVPDDKPDLQLENENLDTSGRPEELAWLADLTPYGDRLMNDLGKCNWPPVEKQAQRHRIGRLRGCELTLQVSHYLRMDYHELKVFTTRIETVYGATFVLIHPWHPILGQVLEPGYEDEVVYYRNRILRGQEPHVSGVRTGGYALNPVNFERIPILVSRLAMDPEQNGAVLGVPAHDPLLFDLAHRVKLPVREVVRGDGSSYDVRGQLKQAFCGEGTLTNSGPYSGSVARVARDRIIAHLGKRGGGRRLTCFSMAHLPVSQTSPWGVPVPMIHCPRCGVVPVPESDLPVMAPGISKQDLERVAESDQLLGLESFPGYRHTTCPKCEEPAERDHRVIQSWLGEAWKYLRPHRPELGGDIPGMTGGTTAASEAEADTDDSQDASAEAPPRVLSIDDLDDETLLGLDALSEETPHLEMSDDEDVDKEDIDSEKIDNQAIKNQEVNNEEFDGDQEDADLSAPPSEADASAVSQPDETAEEHDSTANGSEVEADSAESEVAAAETSARLEAEDSADISASIPSGPVLEAVSDREEGSAGDAQSSATGEEVESAEGVADESSPGYEERQPDSKDENTSSEDDSKDVAEDASEEKETRNRQRSAFQPFRKPSNRRWLSVDLALGRHDRGVMDILCTRFLTKFLYDLREVSFYEPYYRYVRSGDVYFTSHENARKKIGGGANALGAQALELMERHGADAVRLALLNYTEISRPLEISEHRVRCMRRLVHRIYRQIRHRLRVGKFVSRRVLVEKHQLIHEVTTHVRKIRYHRAIASIYHFVKFLESRDITEEEVDRTSIQMFLVLLSPFAPYVASELWTLSGGEGRLEEQPWPEASAELLRPSEVEIPVLIDNRLRRRVTMPAGAEKEQLRQLALQDEHVAQVVAGRPIEKVIAVSDRVVNILLKRSPSPESSSS